MGSTDTALGTHAFANPVTVHKSMILAVRHCVDETVKWKALQSGSPGWKIRRADEPAIATQRYGWAGLSSLQSEPTRSLLGCRSQSPLTYAIKTRGCCCLTPLRATSPRTRHIPRPTSSRNNAPCRRRVGTKRVEPTLGPPALALGRGLAVRVGVASVQQGALLTAGC